MVANGSNTNRIRNSTAARCLIRYLQFDLIPACSNDAMVYEYEVTNLMIDLFGWKVRGRLLFYALLCFLLLFVVVCVPVLMSYFGLSRYLLD